MSPTRRRFLLASTGGITALAGCSALSHPQQSILVAVNNYTDARHQGYLRIENDDTKVVRQYLEVAAAEPDEWETVETEIALGAMPNDTRLDVMASFGDDLEATGSITLDCGTEFDGDAILVQLEADGNLRLTEPCYDGFPSEEASQGGITNGP